MKVGQNIFIKTQGNAARYSGSKIIETKLVKLGRKYFEVEALPRTKFEIETMQEKTDYSCDYIAYESKVAIEEEIEKAELEIDIRKIFGRYGKTSCTLDQLRRINNVLRED